MKKEGLTRIGKIIGENRESALASSVVQPSINDETEIWIQVSVFIFAP